MKMDVRLSPKQMLVFSVLVMLSIMFIGFAARKSINELQSSNITAKKSYELNSKVQGIVRDVLLTESKIRGFVIAEDELFLKGISDTLKGLKSRAAELKSFLETPEYHEKLNIIDRLVDEKIHFTDSIYETYKQQGKKASEELIASGHGMLLRDSILEFADTVNGDLQDKINSHLDQNIVQSNSVKWMELVLSISSVLIILTLTLLIIRKIRQMEFLIAELTHLHEREKEDKEQIEKISNEVEDLYNLAPCGYHSLDSEGYFATINQTELEWLGYNKEDVIGKKKFTEILDEEDQQVFEKKFAEFKQNGVMNEVRIQLKKKNGESFPVLLSSMAIYDEQGNYESCRSTIFDISLQAKYQEELKEAKSLADRSLQIKEQFLANMSHEIRTPLNAILGFSNLLQKTELHGRQKDFANLIKTSSQNLLTIVNDILDISKIEAGMIRFEYKPFHLRQLLESIQYMYAGKCRDKGIQFSVDVEDGIQDGLVGDTVRLTQILMNLVGNAEKFTSKGSINISVTSVSASDDETVLKFSIKDTGAGIPAKSVATIFDRFTQAEESTTRKFGGTGLGLAIVKNLVELQGGSIHVKSVEGVGSDFHFELPFKIAPEDAFIQVVNTEAEELVFANGIKVLVVEDNSINQMLIQYLLKQWDIKYELANNGKEALEKLKMQSYDLILMDIQMPEMNGYETTQHIREQLQLNTPIIAMTAHALPGEKQKCVDAGMNDYISKPLDENELKELIHKQLPTEAEMTDSKSFFEFIDYDLLKERFLGNTSFIQDLIKEIMVQFATDIEHLKNAIYERNHEMVKEVCHHTRNTSMFFKKSTRISEKLQEIETLTFYNNEDTWEQLEVVFNQIANTPEKVTLESMALLSKMQ